MKNTIILYEGKYGITKKTAEILGYVIGNTKVLDINNAPGLLEKYESIIFAFAFYGPYTASKTKVYIKEYNEQLKCKKVGIIGVGISNFDFDTQLKAIREIIGYKEACNAFVEGELRLKNLSETEHKSLEMFCKKVGMSFADRGNFNVKDVIEVAIDFKEKMNSQELVMDKAILMKEIEKFIKSHNTFALATGTGNFNRCTPLEYQYIDKYFYIITEGGLKFKGILQNKNVSVGIYDNYETMGNVRGMQITGRAENVPLFSEKYNKVVENKGIKLNVVENLPINLYVIKIIPAKFEFLNSDFKKNGFDSKQKYVVD